MTENISQIELAENFIHLVQTKRWGDSELQNALNRLDDLSIRTKFKQATDPVNLAFRHIENKPLSNLARDFIKLSAEEVIECISGFFK